MDELTEKINNAVKEKLFIDIDKYENDVNLSNIKPTLQDSEEYKELTQKILEADKWYNEQMRNNKPAIIIDSQGRYVSSYGTASFYNYIEAVKNKQVKIHDKKYKKNISKLIKNNK